MDLFIVRGDWWGQKPYGDVTLENNVFGHSDQRRRLALLRPLLVQRRVRAHRVVNNTFENAVILDNVGKGPYSGVWANNSAAAGLPAGRRVTATTSGRSCHGSDRALNPVTSCAPPACTPARPMPVGFRNPAAPTSA